MPSATLVAFLGPHKPHDRVARRRLAHIRGQARPSPSVGFRTLDFLMAPVYVDIRGLYVADLGGTEMSRRASLVVAVLVLVAASNATATPASKPVTPKLGLYYGENVGKPENGEVSVQEAEVKVVKIGKSRLGAQFRVPIGTTCTGGLPPTGFGGSERTPVPIKNGKFAFDRTTRGPVSGGAGTATTRLVVSGTFKSATKVVVEASAHSSIAIQYPGQPEIKGTCTGKQTVTAKHQ